MLPRLLALGCLCLCLGSTELSAAEPDPAATPPGLAELIRKNANHPKRLVCKREKAVGSHFQRKKCRTREGWRRHRQESQAFLERTPLGR